AIAHAYPSAPHLYHVSSHSCVVSSAAFCALPHRRRAPASPTALGRWKIQFCQAVRRAKIFDSMVSGPPKRKFASSPVSASAEKLARSSRNTRISSSQSKSSRAKGARPDLPPASGSSISPSAPLAFSSAPASARKRLARRESPFDIGYAPKLTSASARLAGGLLSSPLPNPPPLAGEGRERASI